MPKAQAEYLTLRREQIIVSQEYKALVPRPSTEDYRLLKEDIHANGIHTPVVVTPKYVLEDGYTRVDIAIEEGIEEIPVKVDKPRDPLSEREYVVRANLSRRHLTGSQKDKLGLLLLDIERERAKERQIDAGERGAEGGRGHKKPESETLTQNLGEPIHDAGEAVEKAGIAVGRSGESLRKAHRIEEAIKKHPDWTELSTQWEQAQAGNDSTDATYRRLRTLEAEREPLERYGDLRPIFVSGPMRDAPASLAGVSDRIIAGDCRHELVRVPAGSVDLIITSPPYAERRKSTYGGIPPEEYVEWFLGGTKKYGPSISDELLRVLKPTGSFVLVIKEGATGGERETYVMELVLMLKRHGWRWVEEYHWCKKNAMPGKWPTRFQDRWEHVFHFAREPRFAMYQKEVREPIGSWAKTRLKNLSKADMTRLTSGTRSGFGRNMSRWVDKDLVYPSNSLHIAPEAGHKKHSAAFPEQLPAWFIRLFTKKGDIVLDPFLGSGTTAVAALNLERHFIGIERDAQYCKVAGSRIEAARAEFTKCGAPARYFLPVSKTNGEAHK